jgi:hypothetical protein
MTEMTKTEATARLSALGLESLPTYTVSSSAEFDALVSRTPELAIPELVTVRTSDLGATKNLPRLIGADFRSASNWIAAHPACQYLVQPYDDLVYSAEVVLTPEGQIHFELVPGAWELDNVYTPAAGTFSRFHVSSLRFSATVQRSKFWDPEAASFAESLDIVNDWHIESLGTWLADHWDKMCALLSLNDRRNGVKLHYYAHHGISPQNVHRTHLRDSDTTTDIEPPFAAPIITSLHSQLGEDVETLIVDVSVTRENSGQLIAFVQTLRDAAVKTVFLRSGILSHLAIQMREAGITVYGIR